MYEVFILRGTIHHAMLPSNFQELFQVSRDPITILHRTDDTADDAGHLLKILRDLCVQVNF